MPGWIACAPQGASSAFALVQPVAGGKPAVRWTTQLPWDQPMSTLRQLRRPRAPHRQASVALLQRGQYQCLSLDAPADVSRDDWAAAVRWQIQDMVDFPADSAALDVLGVPAGTS